MLSGFRCQSQLAKNTAGKFVSSSNGLPYVNLREYRVTLCLINFLNNDGEIPRGLGDVENSVIGVRNLHVGNQRF
jgi:hypothetical protein